jgi:hypothetical protein
MYLVFYMTFRLNDCDAVKCITRAIGRGGALKISTFLGAIDAHFALCHFMAQKRINSRGPSQIFWAQMVFALLVAISEHKQVLISRPTPSNHYAPRHINKRCIKGTVNDLGGGM